ncbi:Predicted signal transduction protein [Phaffia rhodozyma]|uniref:BRO domain-containing protein 1 n=1 Tax=Phaffia rhodozyma TaxID=264483 RepID=A0A0F7SF77_PHARH|nr:Predicted signal transduction protein [Phaffia rhodozyma]
MTMQSPAISIPSKQTAEVDWSNPIRQIIASAYGENPDSYAEECAALQRARQDAVKGAGSEVTARDLLFRYFGQLELLELRFPDIKVTFPWHDSFTNKLTTQTSLAFEKASVIYQIASTLSILSSTQNRSSPEGLKRAYNFARSAAGMLVYVNENFLHAPSTDLSKEVVKLLIGIMLAQAQEMFTEKVLEEGKAKAGGKGPGNAGIVAKLAAQAGIMYAALSEEVKEFFGKGIIDRNWVALINLKAKYYPSVANYHRAILDDSQSKHGDALVRLRLAETLGKEAQKQAAVFLSSFNHPDSLTLPADSGTALVEITKTHLAVVSERTHQATKENELIYHSILPAEAALPPLDKLSAAQPISIQDTYSSVEVTKLVGQDIFHKLIPLAVHESASVYSEEKAKLSRGEVERSDIAEGEVQTTLEYLGLPSVLNKFRSIVASHGKPGAGLDALSLPGREALDLVEEVGGEERKESIKVLMLRLEEKKKLVGEDLRSCQEDLDKESRECERLRAKYQNSWTQAPSASVARSQREDLRSQQTAYQSASQSDARINALYQTVLPSLPTLCSPEALNQAYTEAVGSTDPASSNKGSLLDLDVKEEEGEERERKEMKRLIGELEERLGRLSRFKKERTICLNDLKHLIQNDDVSQQLLVNRRAHGVEPTLFATELEKFKPFRTRLDHTIEQEKSTLKETSQLLDDLNELRGARQTQDRWARAERAVKDLTARLKGQAEDYKEANSALRRGLEFYLQLKLLSDALRRSVKSFVTTREEERGRLVQQCERGSSSSSSIYTSSHSSVGPPPPVPRAVSSGLDHFASLSIGSAQPQRQPSTGGSYDWRAIPTSPAPTSPYPPPPSNLSSSFASSTIPPPPPPLSQKPDPWDFGANGLSSAFNSHPSTVPTLHSAPSSAPTAHSSYQSPPAPPSSTSSYSPHQSTYSNYGGPSQPAPPAQLYQHQAHQQAYPPPLPPPPTSSSYQSASSASYAPQHVYPAPPAPPRQSSTGNSSFYGYAPPSSAQQQQQHPASSSPDPPPAPSPYGQPGYPSPYQQHQQQYSYGQNGGR